MQAIVNTISALIDTLLGFADFIIDLLLWVPRKIIAEITDWTVTAINWMNGTLNISSLDGIFASVPSSVWWFASVGEVGFGITTVLTAYSIRFVIRRIPGIG